MVLVPLPPNRRAVAPPMHVGQVSVSVCKYRDVLCVASLPSALLSFCNASSNQLGGYLKKLANFAVEVEVPRFQHQLCRHHPLHLFSSRTLCHGTDCIYG